jgi:hypothetical protein
MMFCTFHYGYWRWMQTVHFFQDPAQDPGNDRTTFDRVLSDASEHGQAFILPARYSPERVSDQGIPFAQDGPQASSAAAVPYLRAFSGLSRPSAEQTVRVSRMRDASTGLFGKDLAYCDRNLALFVTGFLEDRCRFGPAGN